MALSNEFGTYSAALVTVSIGARNIQGFADGTYVNITPVNDSVTAVEGADGSVGRAVRASRLYNVEITLLSTARDNQYLSQLSVTDRLIKSATFPISVVDNASGRTKFQSGAAWLTKMPDFELGTEVGDVTWQFQAVVEPSAYIIGGNEE